MNLKNIVFSVLLFSISAAAQVNKDSIISEVFEESSVHGTFVLYDPVENKYFSNDFRRADERFLPASTFKIFNSLAALESGVLKDQDEIIKWDSISRGWEKWDMDHNLRSAIKYSAVWFYQELARRIGEEKMLYYIDKTGYGNKNIEGGIDLFWLQGELKISAMEQIEFLKKLYAYDLPFSRRSMEIVQDIMIRDKTEKYTIHAKTGWAVRVDPQIGWYVGFVEKGPEIYFFAMNMDIMKDEDASKRIELTDLLLKKLNITSDE
jgi:beta-lactamase class D